MIRPIDQNVIVDNGFHPPLPICDSRARSIRIRILHTTRGYDIHLWGTSLRENGSEPIAGLLPVGPDQVRAWVNDLHRAWQTNLIMWQDPADLRVRGYGRYPLAEQVDLRQVASSVRNAMWRQLAVAGHQLFRQLFTNGTSALRQAGQMLADALTDGDHVITVTSDEVIVPWSMLYVPRNIDAHLSDDFTVDPDAFIGYRHLVEHSFDQAHPTGPHIQYAGQASTAAYYDTGIDKLRRTQSRQAIVEPVVDLLTTHTRVHRATRREEVARSLQNAGALDHLIYFCCHCVEEAGDVLLRLTDAAVSGGDLRYWLGEAGLRNSPLVVINACQSGRHAVRSPSDLGRVLLDNGAGCLLGPAVNIPKTFAAAFATDLFSGLFERHERLGEALRAAVRRNINTYLNPLGLAYSLFRGIDSHFCPMEAPGGHVPTKS
jgi:hypothetical protein